MSKKGVRAKSRREFGGEKKGAARNSENVSLEEIHSRTWKRNQRVQLYNYQGEEVRMQERCVQGQSQPETDAGRSSEGESDAFQWADRKIEMPHPPPTPIFMANEWKVQGDE